MHVGKSDCAGERPEVDEPRRRDDVGWVSEGGIKQLAKQAEGGYAATRRERKYTLLSL